MGVSPVDGRYVLVAEKLDNAVLLVDLDRSRAVARRDLDGAPRYVAADPTTWPDAVGVATCAACPYAWVTTNHDGRLYKLSFSAPLANATGDRDRARRLENGTLAAVGETARGLLDAPRMVAVDGSAGFLCEHKRGVVYAFDAAARAEAVVLKEIFRVPSATGVSLWGSSLLVTHDSRKDEGKAPLSVVPRRGGKAKTLRLGDGRHDDGPEDHDEVQDVADHFGHPRDALFDGDRMLLLTHPKNRGGVLCARDASGACVVVAGNASAGSGWRDGIGGGAFFTRPHAMALLPGRQAVVLTDIDNRCLRVVELATGATATVFYGSRDDALQAPEARAARAAPAPGPEALRGGDAAAACARRGRRLCTVAEVLRRDVEADDAWTARKCASCWISSEDVFDKGRTRCTHGQDATSRLPAVARDNLDHPGAWDGGRVAARRSAASRTTTRACPTRAATRERESRHVTSRRGRAVAVGARAPCAWAAAAGWR